MNRLQVSTPHSYPLLIHAFTVSQLLYTEPTFFFRQRVCPTGFHLIQEIARPSTGCMAPSACRLETADVDTDVTIQYSVLFRQSGHTMGVLQCTRPRPFPDFP